MEKMVQINVKSVTSDCKKHFKPGQAFLASCSEIPEGFCPRAFHVLTPIIMALTHGAAFTFREDPHTILTTCPEGNVVFYSESTDDAMDPGRP